MSAVAMGLQKKGYSISGFDLLKNNETKKLEQLGQSNLTEKTFQKFEELPFKEDGSLDFRKIPFNYGNVKIVTDKLFPN